MNKYYIWNEKTQQSFIKEFTDIKEARHFIINHLDLSLNWHIDYYAENPF